MSKQLKTQVVTITTQVVGRKNYISRFSTRADTRILPDYTDDPNKAHDFGTEENAHKHISRIVNHMNRVFDVEIIYATSEERPPVKKVPARAMHSKESKLQ